MTTENIFTSQIPGIPNVFENQAITVATTFRVLTNGTVSGGRFIAASTVGSGTYELVLWQVTGNDNIPNTGSGTILATATFGTISGGNWNTASFSSPVSVTTGVAYRIGVRTSEGRYAATGGFFNSAGVTNGNLSANQTGTNPVGIGNLDNGSYIESITSYPSKTFNGNCYFIDPNFDAASSTTPVTGTTDLRWEVSQQVTGTTDQRWRVSQQITSTTDQRWRVSALVTATTDLRWGVGGTVTSTTDLRWAVLSSTTPVTGTTDLRWAVRAAVTAASDQRWAVRNLVTQATDQQWAVRSVVEASTDQRWRVYAGVNAVSALPWAVRQTVEAATDLRWVVIGQVTATTALRWRVLTILPTTPLLADVTAYLGSDEVVATLGINVTADLR